MKKEMDAAWQKVPDFEHFISYGDGDRDVVVQLVDSWPSMHETLSSIPSTA